MLEIVYGETRNRALADRLAEKLSEQLQQGTVYLGYPVLASSDQQVFVDALLVSPSCGIVAFLIADEHPHDHEAWHRLVQQQDQLYSVLESDLRRHDSLRQGRKLVADPHTVTVFGAAVHAPDFAADGQYCGVDDLQALIESFEPVSDEVHRAIQAALQHVSTIKPAKRRAAVQRQDSRGAVLKEIEKGIANLDEWQKHAAIETPDGLQRIRGLAGSGKTIVLALKAAYLHVRHPEWRIAVTFQSRSLYQQLVDLTTRFTFEQSRDNPDFDRLQILHAWGSQSRSGVYSVLSGHLGKPPKDFNYAFTTYGREAAFAGICGELLADLPSEPEPVFDAVLIDEAQDFPSEFFQLIYQFAREPKRIVWAFDELQKLDEAAMPPTEELFGVPPERHGDVSIVNRPKEPRRDITLPICYRNSPWALATAHAVGLGVYRTDGLVQHFDDPSLWEAIGYRVVSGELRAESRVDLERSTSNTPDYFQRLMTPEDAVAAQTFASSDEQDEWLVRSVLTNLNEDELEADDLLVVLPNPKTSKSRASRISKLLNDEGIASHLVGVNSSADEMFVRDSVAMAHIFRAKGNEAPMVYVLDAQWAMEQFGGVTRRNTLFTAMTRSRAWVRVSGWGPGMQELTSEIQRVREADYHLQFTIPNAATLEKIRRLHRDRTDAEVASIDKVQQGLQQMLDLFDRGDLDLEDLPLSVRQRLAQLPLSADANE
jgi:superfamily I DNA and RNA helicase